jgi:SAM-dependent methyltransferase
LAAVVASASAVAGSSSIEQPNYWWFEVRETLLRRVMQPHIEADDIVLDVGSADSPSVGWLGAVRRRVAMDLDPRGLSDGGVVGSALALPFQAGAFSVVCAFDVIEHCEPEAAALREIHRVLRSGGTFLVSVPAYQWAWTSFDVHSSHYRRYTRRRLITALETSGFDVRRATYGFAGTFAFFAADRLRTRAKERRSQIRPLPAGEVPDLPRVAPVIEWVLRSSSRLDDRLLRRIDLPFGSSLFAVAVKR